MTFVGKDLLHWATPEKTVPRKSCEDYKGKLQIKPGNIQKWWYSSAQPDNCEETCSEISLMWQGYSQPPVHASSFFLFFHFRYICTTGPDTNSCVYHKDDRRIWTFCTSCNMRFICVQCYWQRPKKDPEGPLFWVRKCEIFLRAEHGVWRLLPKGPFAIKSLRRTFAAFEIRESTRKSKGQQIPGW